MGIISGLGIISGSGSFRELYSAMPSNPKSLRTTGNEAAKVSVPFSNLRSGVILFYFFSASLAREGKTDIKG